MLQAVQVTSSSGSTMTCYQNKYGLHHGSSKGGAYPATATNNDNGVMVAGDSCMAVPVLAVGESYNGWSTIANSRDCPSDDNDWPNAAVNAGQCFLAVWIK